MHCVITVYASARDRQTDGETDKNRGNSATIRSNEVSRAKKLNTFNRK